MTLVIQPGQLKQIPNQGTSKGEFIGALACTQALMLFGGLINALNVTAANLAISLANLNTAIGQQEQNASQDEYVNHIQPILDQMKTAKGDDLQRFEQELNVETSKQGAMQASFQQAQKQLDPTTTSAQNMTSQLTQSLNGDIGDVGEIIKILSFVAQLHIN